jgi:putative NADPH-quinone reductase
MAQAEQLKKVLIVYAHPAAQNSFNAAIRDRVADTLLASGVEVRIKDLVRENFDPVIREDEWVKGFHGVVPEECRVAQEEISWAEGLVFICPAWNFGIPAILKGYIDRVMMIPGFSLDMGEDGTDYRGGLLTQRVALVLQTLGSALSSATKYNNSSAYSSSIVSSLYYMGIKDVRLCQVWNLYQAANRSKEMEQILNDIEEEARALHAPRPTRPFITIAR